MEVSVSASAISDLIKRLEKSPKVIQEAKRQAFQTAAPKLKALVQAEIGGSGKVQRWQEGYVGSKGGYAAARPLADTFIETKGKQKGFRAGPKKYAVGYVTNAINSGHRAPRDKWGYRTSSRVVAGKQFYQRAQARSGQVAQEAANQIVQALTDHLGG